MERKFKIKNVPEKNIEPIEFSLNIDTEGNVEFLANGNLIAYIDINCGDLCIAHLGAIDKISIGDLNYDDTHINVVF